MSTIIRDSPEAWLVAAGGFIANFIVGGFAKTLGIIITAFQDLIDSDTAYFTLTGGLIYTFMYLFSLVSHLFTERFGPARVIFIGGLGAALSLIGGSYATTILHWIFFMGICVGLSLSLIYANIFINVGKSFSKYVGLASGMAVAGVSIGQMIFPFLLNYIIKVYSARGGTLVGAAIMLNFCVTAALMPRYIVNNEEERYRLSCKLRGVPYNSETKKDEEFVDEHGDVGNGVKCDTIDIVLDDVPETVPFEKRLAVKAIRQRMHHLLLLVFIILKITADIGDVGQSIILPVYAKNDCKLTDSQINWAIMTAGFVDLISRLVIGRISDMKFVRRSVILTLAYGVEAVVALVFAFSKGSYVTFVICYGIFGAASGTAVTLMVVVITDFVTPKNFAKGFAMTMAVVGVFIAAGMYLIGLIRDLTGNFFFSFVAVSLLMTFSTLMMLLEYPIRGYFEKREAEVLSGVVDDDKSVMIVKKTNGITHLDDDDRAYEPVDCVSMTYSKLNEVSIKNLADEMQ